MNIKLLKNLIVLILIFLNSIAVGQIDVGIRQWRIHLPYNAVHSIAETPTHLFIGSERGFYTFHKKSGETEIFSKVNGFSDVEVSKLKYHEGLDIMFIAYENTNIDILQGNKIYNISDILRKSILGLKRINDIHFEGNLAYLSCSFGIVIIDLEKRQVKDSYLNIGPNGTAISISSLAFMGDSIYVGTEIGIMSAFKNHPVLSDFTNWKIIHKGLRPQFQNCRYLRVFADTLYADVGTIFEQYDGANWKYFVGNDPTDTKSVEIAHEQLVIAQVGAITIVQKDGSRRVINENVLNFAILDFEDNIWTGGDLTGLIKITPSGQYSYVKPNGPQRSTSYAMMPFLDGMWVTGGGVSTARNPIFNNAQFYVFNGTNWESSLTDPRLVGSYDFVSIVGNEATGEVFVGSHGWGLLHLKNGVVIDVYTDKNSTIERNLGGFAQVDGLAIDDDQNLWVANYDAIKALSVRTPDGSWNSFELPATRAAEIVIDDFGQKWITAPKESSYGIMVFKETDGPMGSQFKTRNLINSPGQGGLPSNDVNALVVDQDGEIWIGTDEGLAIFYNPQCILDGGTECDAQQRIIDDGKDVGYLLGNEVINDLQIDGANRKWVATNTGAWLIEEDGSEVLLHFTTQNSPLVSDIVNCIGIMPETGEVFFGTAKGIISYRGDATAGNNLHGNVVLFPNPIRPDYKGPITITGLPQNATVKITDVSGRVVYEMISNGGTAVWDGNNFNGERAQTGIYLFFTANEDDEDARVTKLLLVN
jgi:TSS9, PorZ, N-terminal beta-propeller domain/Two component regulator propeller